MDVLLKYLPLAEQRSLKERQANYDPRRAAKSRERSQKQNTKRELASVTRSTDSPYGNALARHKRIASKILDVLDVRVNGNKAVIKVSTTSGGKVNNVEYRYGTANIELVGEERFWRIDSYNDSPVVYKHRPQPKR